MGVFYDHDFTLHDPAVEGTSFIELSLNTGPHQGVITGSNTFYIGDPSPEPQLLSIVDIPDDQGGEVRLIFRRSKYDGLDSTFKIVSYTVWRLIENSEWDAVGMFNAV